MFALLPDTRRAVGEVHGRKDNSIAARDERADAPEVLARGSTIYLLVPARSRVHLMG